MEKQPQQDGVITPELLLVMSAAIAAYLGRTVRIRQARFLGVQQGNSWGQSGRVILQTSHYLKG
ncbi:MAG TPA: hypothetical protein VJ550_12300 [Geomonas sp.]|nr:hypothetical protein [Geomonas sp.]